MDTARRTVDAREMAAMPRSACLLYNLTALFLSVHPTEGA